MKDHKLTLYKAFQNEVAGIIRLLSLSGNQSADSFHRIKDLIELYSEKLDDMVHNYDSLTTNVEIP